MLGKLTSSAASQASEAAATAEQPRLRVVDGMGTEPMLGWRAWKCVRQDDGTLRLVSPVFGTVWQAGWNNAERCSSCKNVARDECVCGINACKRRSELGIYAVDAVVGRVELAGEVRQFKRGWRAERARPVELHMRPGQETLAAELADVYGCPVRADRAWRLEAVLWLLAIIASAGATWLLFTHFIHSGERALLAGQDSPFMLQTALTAVSLMYLTVACLFRALHNSRFYALLALCLAAALVSGNTTKMAATGFTHFYRTQVGEVARTGTARTVHITQANAGSLLRATDVAAGDCKTERWHGHRVRLCRQSAELRMTRVK